MQGMWVSVKENINCMHNMNDIICQPKQLSKHEGRVDDRITMADIPICKRMNPPCIFTEVGEGDLSRKVIEHILGAALTSSTRKTGKIRKVFRVKNSLKLVDSFENFREMVKKKAMAREKKHTRSLVDGNELLCFYVTTITCISKESKHIAVPCECSDCKFCQVIRTSFDRSYTERSGMELSINSISLRERIDAQSKKTNTKRVVVICRIIAGRTISMGDMTSEDEYDSILKRGVYPNSQHLIVHNPNAVLPCFAVILS